MIIYINPLIINKPTIKYFEKINDSSAILKYNCRKLDVYIYINISLYRNIVKCENKYNK